MKNKKRTFFSLNYKQIIIVFAISFIITFIYSLTTTKKNIVEYTVLLSYSEIPYNVIKELIKKEFVKNNNFILSSINDINKKAVKIKIYAHANDSLLISNKLNKISYQLKNDLKQEDPQIKFLIIEKTKSSYNEKILEVVSTFLISLISGFLLIFIFKN